MAYEFRYRLQQAPEAKTDGSGIISHDIFAVYRTQGTTDPFVAVPGYHQTVNVSSAELKTVMDMVHGTTPQKQAKNAAYRALIGTKLGVSGYATPALDWDTSALSAYMTANDAAKTERDRADTYLTVTLAQSYPVDFTL